MNKKQQNPGGEEMPGLNFQPENIVQENRCWLVMDLARGGDLHNKIFDELNISIKRGDRVLSRRDDEDWGISSLRHDDTQTYRKEV